MQFDGHPIRLLAVVSAVAAMLSCGSEHTTYEAGSRLDASSENDPEIMPDGGTVATFSCDGETGVVVSGAVRFEGQVPEGARLWLYWTAPEGGIPPCSMEITPVGFPAEFRFENVPPDKGWLLVAFIDVDGGFPPIPGANDYQLEVPADQLDLSQDNTELDLTIPTTPLP